MSSSVSTLSTSGASHVSHVSVTKIRHLPGSPSQPSRQEISSVTVRPARGCSFTPLATYLGSDRSRDTSAPPHPEIEIRVNHEDEDNNQELPPGTKIITHPMINNSRAWDGPVVSRK